MSTAKVKKFSLWLIKSVFDLHLAGLRPVTGVFSTFLQVFALKTR